MRGYVTKKGKKYYVVIYDGIDPATGKEKRRWVAAGNRRDDADKLVTELTKREPPWRDGGEREADAGPVPDDAVAARPGEPAAGEHVRLLQAQHRPARHPGPGERLLDRLTAEDIDLFYAPLLKDGTQEEEPDGEKVDAEGLAPKTVHNIHVMLNKALSDAARKGTVVRNVVAMVDPRRCRPASATRSRRGTSISSSRSSARSPRTGCRRRSSLLLTPGCAGRSARVAVA